MRIKKNIKKFVGKLDRKLFGGKFRSAYFAYLENKKKQFFKTKNISIICEPVPDMLLMQYNLKDYQQYQFYDLAVRYLAIEEYYGKNNYGFQLYKKMHYLGGNYGQNNMTEEYYNKMRKKNKTVKYGLVKEEHSIEQFQALINAYETKGYDPSSIIMADKNLLSMNGSHRIALAVYRGQEFINTEVHNTEFRRRFSYDWFWKVGFDNEELHIIKNTQDLLLNRARELIGDYYCILYPPAYEYFDEITRDLSELDPDNIVVTGIHDYQWDTNNFIAFLHAIYSFDSILKKNLERKIFYILKATDIVDKQVPFRIVSVKIRNPLYRLKSDNGMPESMATVRLKEVIRDRYKLRNAKFSEHFIGDYAHDVIIHSTDNYLSNKAMRLLLSINKDLSDLITVWNDFSYAVIESGIEKLHSQFPKDFYFNEDIDILVRDRDLTEITDRTVRYCQNVFSGEWISVEVCNTSDGNRVKVMLRDCMIIMFDLMVSVEGLNEEYIQKAIEQSEWKIYKYLRLEDELIVRLAKFSTDQSKTWHVDFINKYKDFFVFDSKAFVKPKNMKKIYEKIASI